MKLATTIVADPPWPFKDKLPGKGRGAAKHYKLLSIEDIKSFPLPVLADNARLFLWRVASQQEGALAVVRAWGFVPKAEMIWVKTKDRQHLQIGMGHQVRNCHEACIIAVRGRPLRLSMAIPSVFFAPRAQHSAKPECFFDFVESLSPGPYVELFARRLRSGWLCFGDEINKPRRQQ